METYDALVSSQEASTRWTAAGRGILQANRVRTRDRACVVVGLGAEIRGGSSEVMIIDREGKVIISQTIPGAAKDSLGTVWCEVPPTEIPAYETFYIAAALSTERCFRFRAETPKTHPALVLLGGWVCSDRLSPPRDWRPCPVLGMSAVNFRFQIGARNVGSIRQNSVLSLAAEGLTDKEIARRLGVSPNTVDFHWRSIRQRLGAASRTEAVATHLGNAAERLREDIEAERDRFAAEAWLARHMPMPADKLCFGTMRSWPLP